MEGSTADTSIAPVLKTILSKDYLV